MNSDVIVSIKGMQFGGEDAGESIENEYSGTYYRRDAKHYIIYNEVIEGYKDPVKCMIKVGFNEISVTKRGVVNVDMPFKIGTKKLANYETMYGGITLGFQTKNITVKEMHDSMDIDIDYKLDVNYEFLADCQISIRVKNKAP